MALLALATFACSSALDFCYAQTLKASADGDGHRVGLWSMAMYLIELPGFFGVLKVSPWMIVPECLGLYVGSRLAYTKRVRADLRK